MVCVPSLYSTGLCCRSGSEGSGTEISDLEDRTEAGRQAGIPQLSAALHPGCVPGYFWLGLLSGAF